MTRIDRRSSLLAKLGAALAVAAFLVGGSFVGAAQADWHHGHGGWHHGGWHHDHGWGGYYGGGYYAGPPVVYGGGYYAPGYYPPPVVYGPSVGVTLPGVSIGIN